MQETQEVVESRRLKFFISNSDGGTVIECRDDFNVSFASKLFNTELLGHRPACRLSEFTAFNRMAIYMKTPIWAISGAGFFADKM